MEKKPQQTWDQYLENAWEKTTLIGKGVGKGWSQAGFALTGRVW